MTLLNDTVQLRFTLVSVQTVNFESLLKKACRDLATPSGNRCGLTCNDNVKAEQSLTCSLNGNIVRLDNLIDLLKIEVGQ